MLKSGEGKAAILVRESDDEVKTVVVKGPDGPVFQMRWDRDGVHLDEPSEVVEGGWEQMISVMMPGNRYLHGPGGVRFEFGMWQGQFPVIIFATSTLPEGWSA